MAKAARDRRHGAPRSIVSATDPQRQASREEAGNELILRDEARPAIRTAEEYLQAVGLPLDCLKQDADTEFVVTRQRLNKWPTPVGEGRIADLFQVELHLVRRKPVAVAMPALSACNIVIPKPVGRAPAVSDSVQRAVILPDMQIGYRRDLHSGLLTEFHDRNAIDVALQVIADVQPHVVVLLGDNLDLPDWSDKFVRAPEMYFTTEPAKREYAYILGRIRATMPHATIVAHLGNHEERMSRAAATYMLGSGGVRGANGTDYLAVPAMVDPLNALNVEWLPYPDGEYWLNPNIRTIHGTIANGQPGATARKYLETARCSVVYGHVHRREALAVTHLFSGGQRTYIAESPGCLCHTDGRVPGSSKQSNWQNGISLVEFEPTDDGLFNIEWVPIFGGRAVYRGHRYEGEYDIRALIDATGWETFKQAA